MGFKVGDIVVSDKNGIGMVKAIDPDSKMFRNLVRFVDFGLGWYRDIDLKALDPSELEKAKKSIRKRMKRVGSQPAYVLSVPMVSE